MIKDVIYIDRLSIDDLILSLRKMRRNIQQGYVGDEYRHHFLDTKDGRKIILAIRRNPPGSEVQNQKEGS